MQESRIGMFLRSPRCVVAVVAATLIVCMVNSLSAQGAGVPEITRGPYLQDVEADRATIMWRTNIPSLGSVELASEDGAEQWTATEESHGLDHKVTFTGLTHDRLYSYSVLDEDILLESDLELEFRTAKLAGEGEVRFTVIGDSGGDINRQNGPQHSITAMIEAYRPDAFLHTGDIFYTETVDEVFFKEYRKIFSRAPAFIARGNHSHGVLDWPVMFSLPEIDASLPACSPPLCDEITAAPETRADYFSIDWGDAHIAFVDSNTDFRSCSSQLDWLCRDLADAKSRGMEWLILFVHHNMYTVGANDLPDRDENREFTTRNPSLSEVLLAPIADRFEVDLVLAGHDHNYQRTHPLRGGTANTDQDGPFYYRPEGTFYIVTGGGGGLPYPIFDNRPEWPLFKVALSVHHMVELSVTADFLDVRAVKFDGAEIDHFTVSKTRESPGTAFVRGDCNDDGQQDLADAVCILNWLFLAGGTPGCVSATDANGDENSDIADATYLLLHLFLGGAAPVAPYPECGPGTQPADEENCENAPQACV